LDKGGIGEKKDFDTAAVISVAEVITEAGAVTGVGADSGFNIK
jgi:hypothetical protein